MKLIPLALLSLALFLPLTALADIIVRDPQTFATSAVQKNGAAFFSLENTGQAKDQLVKVEVDTAIASKAELHTHLHENGVMQMREVPAFDIPAGQKIRLEPMGHHIMLMGLQKQLKTGDRFPMTLTFKKAGPQEVNVDVVKPGELSHNGH